MNLVAKEFVAAQDPADPGVLVLSRFAGAARQLEGALLVNPNDPDEIADALDEALRMPLADRQARWRASWAAIGDCTALAWGRGFLAALLRASATSSGPALRLVGRNGVEAPPAVRAEMRVNATDTLGPSPARLS